MGEAETGLVVRASPKGRVSFLLMARFPTSGKEIGHASRRLLGDYCSVASKDRVYVVAKDAQPLTLDAACQKAREWKALVTAGIDPAKENVGGDGASSEASKDTARTQTATLEGVLNQYYKRHIQKHGQKDGRGKPLPPLRSADEIERIFNRYIPEDLDGNVRWRNRDCPSSEHLAQIAA